ncbi:MAG: argininosuccinate lyase [Roseobacter sp.]|nr:argininosuccinate lyase [Roseobacter sp.]
MVRYLCLGLGLLVLAGCGADGAPMRPSMEKSDSAAAGGVTLSGYGTVGVVYE